jgi:hypothetical protein
MGLSLPCLHRMTLHLLSLWSALSFALVVSSTSSHTPEAKFLAPSSYANLVCRSANNLNVYSQIYSKDAFDVKSILVGGTTRLLVYGDSEKVQASTCLDDLCLKLTPGFTLKSYSSSQPVIETGTTGPHNLPVVAIVSTSTVDIVECTDASCTQISGVNRQLSGLCFIFHLMPCANFAHAFSVFFHQAPLDRVPSPT